MKVLYRKRSLQGNADFFSRLIDLGDGSHAVRVTVNEIDWNDSEFCQEGLNVSPHSQSYAFAEVLPIGDSPETNVFPVEAVNPEALEDPYRHHNLPPVTLSDLRHHQANDPLCQAISNHEQTGLFPPATLDGDLRGAAEWIEENALSLIRVHGVWFRLGDHTLGKGNGVRQVTAALVPPTLRDRVMKSAHCHQVLGHRGVAPTYRLLRESYYWRGMSQDVAAFVHKCAICQDKYRPAQKVKPLRRSVPEKPWQLSSMDFAGPFGPLSNKVNNYALVYVDNFPDLPS